VEYYIIDLEHKENPDLLICSFEYSTWVEGLHKYHQTVKDIRILRGCGE